MAHISSLSHMYVHIHQVLKLTCNAHDLILDHAPTQIHVHKSRLLFTCLLYPSLHEFSSNRCTKLLPLIDNAQKPNFEALCQNEKLHPLQGSTHTLWAYHQHIQVKKSRIDLSWDHYKLILQAKTHPQNEEFSYPGFHRHWLKPISISAQFLTTFPHSISAPRRRKSTTSDKCEHCSFCVQNDGLNVPAVFRCMHWNLPKQITSQKSTMSVDHTYHCALCIVNHAYKLALQPLPGIYSPVVIKTCTVFVITVR